MFNRAIIKDLNEWANSAHRKPLILRGARQTGKTVAVNIFAANFSRYVYLDLQKADDKALFKINQTAHQLLQLISVKKNVDLLSSGRRLIFIDEIQNSPEATAMLRYLYEEYPQIHIIAAGSLLEVMMETKQISFPVGRVEYRFMYPLTFHEFLMAMNKNLAAEALYHFPFESALHDELMALFRQFVLIGGMPEIVQRYSQEQNIKALTPTYEGLLVTYMNDISKYALSESSARYLRHCIETAPGEIGKRIKFQGFGQSKYRSREMKETLQILERAMLVRLFYPTTAISLPALPQYKKAPKLQFLDTGLINYKNNLQTLFLEYPDISAIYNGIIAEHAVYQEIISNDSLTNRPLLFWVREKHSSSAELDYVFPLDKYLIPVEIKAGKSGRLRSLHQFIDSADHSFAIRLYNGSLSIENNITLAGTKFTLLNLPLYLASQIEQYARGMIYG